MGNVRAIEERKELARAQRDIRRLVLEPLPGWHAPPAFLDLERLDRTREPFWESHEGRTFVHEEAGQVTAWVTAFVSKGGSEHGRFGAFESVDSPAAARGVLDAAASWLASKGARTMEGPFFLSMHEEVGLLVEGFERPSAIYMPFNSPQAGRLLEGAGFSSIRSFGTFRYDLEACYQATVARGPDRPGITARAFDRSREAAEIGALLEVYNSAFSDNWGFTPLTERQARALVKNLLTVGDPRLVRIAEHEGRPVGFILCVPDVNSFFHRVRGWPAFLKLPALVAALMLRRVRDCRVITLAVHKDLQGQRISHVLIKSLASAARAIGYGDAELSYVDKENHWMNRLMKGYNFGSQKEYRIYAKELPPSQAAA